MTATLEDFFSETLPPPDPLRDDLIDMIRKKADSNPRHLQRELGPSEIGTPCMRKLAYGLMQVPRANPEWDPLPSIIGTATHTWLQDAAEQENARLGRTRWLTETRVEVTPDLSGSCDLFDLDTGTVIDHKVLGVTTFMAKIKDPGPVYKSQVMLYGRGFQNLGHTVKEVAIAIYPRAGTLTKMHLWRAPYDDTAVDSILTRRNAVISLVYDFDVETYPERYYWIPATPDACTMCAWWRPEPKSPIQCDGRTP